MILPAPELCDTRRAQLSSQIGMGYTRLGELSRTRTWQEVVGLVAGGAGACQGANSVDVLNEDLLRCILSCNYSHARDGGH